MVSLRKPRCKANRRFGVDLLVTSGIKEKKHKTSPPGGRMSRRPSDYGLQLQMKQMIRVYYGGIREKQMKIYFKKASQQKGATGQNLLMFLESRLDNMVYRMGFACTRHDARQLVSHGHVRVNGQKVDRPSMIVQVGDKVSIAEKAIVMERVQFALKVSKDRKEASWLDVDKSKCIGTFQEPPKLEELPPEFKIKLVVELYSK